MRIQSYLVLHNILHEFTLFYITQYFLYIILALYIYIKITHIKIK